MTTPARVTNVGDAMSSACYRFFVRVKPQRSGGAVEETTNRAARLVFEAIMSAPDLPAERRSGRDL